MIFLPRNLAALAKGTAKDSSRYVMQCVKVTDPGNETYRVEVTDGRQLIVVRGNSGEDNGCENLDAMDNTGTEALIEAKDWLTAFALGNKDRELAKKGVAVVIGQTKTTFAVQGQTLEAKMVEGRFPPIDAVIPNTPPILSFAFSAEVLGKVLNTLAGLGVEEVELLFFSKNAPVGIAARLPQHGQYLDAMVMPIEKKKKE